MLHLEFCGWPPQQNYSNCNFFYTVCTCVHRALLYIRKFRMGKFLAGFCRFCLSMKTLLHKYLYAKFYMWHSLWSYIATLSMVKVDILLIPGNLVATQVHYHCHQLWDEILVWCSQTQARYEQSWHKSCRLALPLSFLLRVGTLLSWPVCIHGLL